MMTKNIFEQTAQRYSGSLWYLWLMVATQTIVALELLFPLQRVFWWSRWIGGLSVFLVMWYCGALIYYYTHREQLAANPAPPIKYGKRELLWTVGIVLGIIAVFVVLELTVWRS